MPNFLYMSHIPPFPQQGGERIRAAGLLRMLGHLGEVAAIVDHRSEALPPDFPTTIQLYPFDFLQHMKPVVRYYQHNAVLMQHFESILEKHSIDVVILDYQFYGNYIHFFQQRGIRVIYSTHNAEASLTKQEIGQQQGVKILEKFLLYHLQHFHEKRYFPQADGFLVVSAEDQQYYQRWVDPKKILLLPNFLYDELYHTLPAQHPHNLKKIVFTANFTVFQNQMGLEWFVKQVWQAFQLYQDFELCLVGRGSQEVAVPLMEKQVPGVSATGTLDSISEAIQDACVAIVPLLHGSGTRLKVLEAMWHRIPVVSTKLGVEGVEGDSGIHFMVADQPQAFAKQLRLLQDTEIRQHVINNAWQLLQEKYMLASNQERFSQFLKERL